MCIHLKTREGYFALEFPQEGMLVFAKQFRANWGHLLAYTMKYEYKLRYSKTKHWLYVPPRLKTQPVDLSFWSFGQGDEERRHCLRRQMRLGYHASFFSSGLNRLYVHENCIMFPVLSLENEVMIVDGSSVVVQAFRIPDPDYYPTLYKQFFKHIGSGKGGDWQVTPLCRSFFKSAKRRLNRR